VVSGQLSVASDRSKADGVNLATAIESSIVPSYFAGIDERLHILSGEPHRQLTTDHRQLFTAGGTDLYVQRPEEMESAEAIHLFDDESLRFIRENDAEVEIGASVVVTDLFESEIFTRLFPDHYRHLKLVSSTPIRNMATLAGNFVNASPIGDMTAWFLALDANLVVTSTRGGERVIPLREFYLGYKKLAKTENEFVSAIRFSKDFGFFNFEKVCKRQYLDIASVNTAIALKLKENVIEVAHVSAGGVFATPLYLAKTSEYLRGKAISGETVRAAAAIIQTEIAPISDVRGSKEYKRLLLEKLFEAHFEDFPHI
jgi:xanthine dehydrogenase small subunit